MAKKEENAVATKAEAGGAVAVMGDDFAQYAGAGMENVGSSDILVPRLSIIQQLSPQINQRKSEYIDGASVGDICDVGTGELFKQGIIFIPVYYRKDYLEWAPRASGSGLVAIHSDASILDKCQRNEKNQPILANGNYIAETAQWFGINLSADGRRSFIPMASTQLKRSRRWMTLATGEKLARSDGSTFTPPLFYRSYSLTSASESNNQGDWFGWKVERSAPLPELGDNWRSIRDECIAFREQLTAGVVRGDLSESHDSSSEESM
jgi:hypothetical protein